MTWSIVAAIAGGIVLVGNAGAMVYKWIRPALQVKKDVEKLDRRTKADYESLKRIEEALERIEKRQRGIVISEIEILNHMIDGNNTEKMKETRDKIQATLADDN